MFKKIDVTFQQILILDIYWCMSSKYLNEIKIVY